MLIVIEGQPIAKMRHRYAVRGKFVRTYDPQSELVKDLQEELKKQLALMPEVDDFPKDTALRLDIFNSVDVSKESKNFTGLPCPAAAGMVATSVLFYHFVTEGGMGDSAIKYVASKDIFLLLLMYTLSYLMVSSHQYLSFKHPETDKVKTFQMLVATVLIVMLVATEPQVTLFLLGIIYVLSGPIGDGYRLLTKHRKVASEQEHSA